MLINVDVKIGSQAIAKRLENILPYVIHHNQCVYVNGRTIFYAVSPEIGGGGGGGRDSSRQRAGMIVKIMDLVSFRVSKRLLCHQSLSWYLLGYRYCS